MKKLLVITALSLLISGTATAQSWVYTGSMHTERRHHVAYLLNTGKILVAGGTDQPQSSLSSCELYDPSTGLWTVSASMNLSRERHTLNELADGRLAIIGGNSGNTSNNQVTGSIEVYDPATDVWTNAANLATPRQNHASVTLADGRVLVIGGFTGYSTTTSCEIFDPSTNTVSAAGSLNVSRHEPQAALLNNGEVIVIGGRGYDYLTETEIYDPVTDTWRLVGKMKQPRMIGSLVVFADGTVLTTGGRKSPTEIAPGAEVFDMTTETWKSIQPLQKARHWQGSVLMPNNRYLITGGYYDGDLSTNSEVDCTLLCEWYNKDNETWYFAPELNKQRGQHGAVYFKHMDGDVLRENVIVTGGIIADYQITNTCEILDVTEEAINTYIQHQPNSGVIIPSAINDMVVVYSEGSDLMLGSKLAEAEYSVISATGQVISRGHLQENTILNLSQLHLATGLYFIQIRTSTGSSVIKVML